MLLRQHLIQEMNEDQPPAENGCMLWSDGMDLLKDAAERKHLLPTGLEGYSYLECNHFLSIDDTSSCAMILPADPCLEDVPIIMQKITLPYEVWLYCNV